MVDILILCLGYDSVADNGLIFDLLYLVSRHHLLEKNTLAHHFSSDIDHEIGTRWLAIQIEAEAIFLIFLILFGAHMNILVTIRVYTLFLLERSHRTPDYVEW